MMTALRAAQLEKSTFSHLVFSSRVGTHVAVDQPQCIGRTLHTDAKLTSKIPPLCLISAYTGINCRDVTFHDGFSPAYWPSRR